MPEIKSTSSATSDCVCASACAGKSRVTLMVIAGILMVLLAVWIGFKARNAWREYSFIGVPIERNSITVEGEGRITVMPDIAKIQLGNVVERATVAAAQQENTKAMNALSAKLAELGVDKADVQTANYSINPSYDWNEGKQLLRGYQVAQNMSVKIRNLDQVGAIIGLASDLGLNQVGGIEFTVDEPEVIKHQARIKALENAKSKGEALAQVVGVKLRRVISFSESSYEPAYNRAYAAKDMVLGMGGGEMAPTIEPGSSEYVLQAYVTYEIE